MPLLYDKNETLYEWYADTFCLKYVCIYLTVTINVEYKNFLQPFSLPVTKAGFEPVTSGLRVKCSTTVLVPLANVNSNKPRVSDQLKEYKEFELKLINQRKKGKKGRKKSFKVERAI